MRRQDGGHSDSLFFNFKLLDQRCICDDRDSLLIILFFSILSLSLPLLPDFAHPSLHITKINKHWAWATFSQKMGPNSGPVLIVDPDLDLC